MTPEQQLEELKRLQIIEDYKRGHHDEDGYWLIKFNAAADVVKLPIPQEPEPVKKEGEPTTLGKLLNLKTRYQTLVDDRRAIRRKLKALLKTGAINQRQHNDWLTYILGQSRRQRNLLQNKRPKRPQSP